MDIDFVITWVNGNDPEWIADFNRFAPERKRITDIRNERYRESGLLKYWFRGVEKFAPWVRKIHFVTCGQKPDWLNIKAQKLHCVKHNEYIPSKYLPVFSSHPIELMMHKIPDLAEHFVYFNDDFYITSVVQKEFFFKHGLPCDAAILNVIPPQKEQINMIKFNNLVCINNKIEQRAIIKKNLSKWFNIRYGLNLVRNILLLPYSYFPGFLDPHTAVPYTKTSIQDAWKIYSEELYKTMESRFRSTTDVNQWLFRYLRLCNGMFSPQNPQKWNRFFTLNDDPQAIKEALISHKYKEIIINDSNTPDYNEKLNIIKEGFDFILPEKSSFEL